MTKSRIPWGKVLMVVTVIAALLSLAALLPIGSYMECMSVWVEGMGHWGPVVFIILYILAVVFFLPGSILTALAGTLFGLVSGTIYVSVASTVGATLSFLIGRYFARQWIEQRIDGNERFMAIDRAVADKGWKIIGLTRLSPVFPFSVLNYGYGVTNVKLSHYILSSWISMLPATILYVYIGSLGKAVTDSGGKSVAEWAMLGVGLLATVLVTIYITTIAKQALNSSLESA